MMPEINCLDYSSPDFYQQLDTALAWEASIDGEVASIVTDILADVKKRGDEAVIEYTNRFDRMNLQTAAEFELDKAELEQALESIDPAQRDALEQAAKRIERYAERQKMESWSYTEADGTVLGQRVNPMDRAGLYVPPSPVSIVSLLSAALRLSRHWPMEHRAFPRSTS